jgi:hypothetical protein
MTGEEQDNAGDEAGARASERPILNGTRPALAARPARIAEYSMHNSIHARDG